MLKCNARSSLLSSLTIFGFRPKGNVLESITSRDGPTEGFKPQVFTTRTAHNFEDGDLIQVSVHFQKYHAYYYNPRARNTASLPFKGGIHAHMLEVVKVSATEFEANRISYVQNVTKDGNDDMVIAIKTYVMYIMSQHQIALGSGHEVEIECYECGVDGLDSNMTASGGYTNHKYKVKSVGSSNYYSETSARGTYNVYEVTITLETQDFSFWNYTSIADNRAFVKYRTQSLVSANAVKDKTGVGKVTAIRTYKHLNVIIVCRERQYQS